MTITNSRPHYRALSAPVRPLAGGRVLDKLELRLWSRRRRRQEAKLLQDADDRPLEAVLGPDVVEALAEGEARHEFGSPPLHDPTLVGTLTSDRLQA